MLLGDSAARTLFSHDVSTAAFSREKSNAILYPERQTMTIVQYPTAPNVKPLMQLCRSLSVELAPLDVDAVLADCHAQVLHGEYGSVLATALSTTTITRTLHTQWPTTALVLGVWLRLSGDWNTGSRSQIAHRVVGARVRCSDPAVLVCVCGDISDEFLGREREKAREALVGLWWRGETGFSQVEVGDGIWNLHGASQYNRWTTGKLWRSGLTIGE